MLYTQDNLSVCFVLLKSKAKKNEHRGPSMKPSSAENAANIQVRYSSNQFSAVKVVDM